MITSHELLPKLKSILTNTKLSVTTIVYIEHQVKSTDTTGFAKSIQIVPFWDVVNNGKTLINDANYAPLKNAPVKYVSKQTPRYQTVAGNWVFSVLSSDPMGGSYPWVHVPWPIKFGPRATQGLAGACLHFSPLPKVIFSGALSQPFWIAESWFLLRNFWHYNLPRIWYDISSNQKFCILRFSTLWNTFKKNFI